MTKQNGPVTLSVSGMTCGGCASTVKRVLTQVAGVTNIEVDLTGGRAVVAGTAEPQDLVAAVTGAGFGAQLS